MNKAPTPVLAAAATLPPEVTARMLADVDVIARRMARRLLDELPLPPEFATAGYLRTVLQACRDGVQSLLRQLHDGRKPRAGELARLGSAGARQAELGVPLEVLLAAYRLAAKIVWQEVIAEATRLADLPPQTVVSVTGEVLEYLDEISAAVGSAYLATRERIVRQRDRERDRILQRLLAGEVPPDVRRIAATHDLDLLPSYRVVACALPDGGEPRTSAEWADTPLVPDDAGIWIALLRPDADPAAFSAALRSSDGTKPPVVAAGPVAVTLDDVAGAARRARRALDAGRRLDPSVRLHDEATVGVFAALTPTPELHSLVDSTLGPVLALPAPRRDEMLRTLDALVSRASIADAAEALGLHRHTLVYRLQRLRELLGVDLDDALVRHRVWLALQGVRLTAAEPATAG